MSLPFRMELVGKHHTELLLDYCKRNRDYLEPFEPERDEDYYTLEHQSHVVCQAMLACQQDLGYSHVLLAPDEEKLIGRINLSNVARGVFQNATLGYSIDAHYAGKGWMTEAVRFILQFGFRQLILHRIQAGVMPHNKSSIRVLEKTGFRYEGRALRYLKINGSWEDHDIFAITQEEWEELGA